MPTLTTAVRALQLGDVLVDPLPTPVGGASSYVVLDLAIADPGPVGVQLARLGPIPAHLDRVATVSWPADIVLEVRRRAPGTGAAVAASAALVALADLEKAAKAGPAHAAGVTERATKIRAALLSNGEPETTGVPVAVARTLLRQAELFEQLFGLHDVLDVAYVADSLRVAAGVPPMHDGATSERSAQLEQRRTRALALLEDVERLAAGGHVARVQLVDGEPTVSSATVHASVAQAVEEARVKAWHAMVAERDNLARQLQGATPREPYSVQPNRCSCHPETCACKPWTLKQGAATVTGFQDRDAAVETARRLNAS
jgi:hypothetical protein